MANVTGSSMYAWKYKMNEAFYLSEASVHLQTSSSTHVEINNEIKKAIYYSRNFLHRLSQNNQPGTLKGH